MQDRKQIQQVYAQQVPNYNHHEASPGINSPWLKYNGSGISPHQGSISMQQDDDNNNNDNNDNKDNDEEEEEEENGENEEKTDRLSSGFSRPFRVFMSLIIILTACLLMYSNTRDGAFVQVQVTPIIPTSLPTSVPTSNIIDDNGNVLLSSPLIVAYTDQMRQEMQFIQKIQSLHPYLKVSDMSDEMQKCLNNSNFSATHAMNSIINFNKDDLKKEYDFEVFNFTLTSSIDDFWAAKAYELAFIIAAFSGAWPYIKLLLLLVIWLHPIKPKQRKKGLLILDQLGKYSFIDLYVCIFMVVSFYLTIHEQKKNNGLGVDVAVIVQIDTGVTTFAIATLLSMIYSMLFIYYDEQKRLKKRLSIKDKDKDKEKQKQDDEQQENIEFDCFENEIEKYSELYEWKHNDSIKIYALYDLPDSLCGIIWRCLFLILIIGNVYLCIDTIFTAPVRYNMEGLAGWAVSDNIRSYSIIDTVNKLPTSTDKHGAAWFCLIQYYMTVIIAPIFISMVIVFIWLFPINYKYHNIICHLLFPFQAWNALDVFMVGAIAASVELDQVSEWILNTNYPCVCGDGGIIQTLLGVGCFSVKGHLTYGSLLLLIFVILEWFALIYTRNHIYKTHIKLSKYNNNNFKPIQM